MVDSPIYLDMNRPSKRLERAEAAWENLQEFLHGLRAGELVLTPTNVELLYGEIRQLFGSRRPFRLHIENFCERVAPLGDVSPQELLDQLAALTSKPDQRHQAARLVRTLIMHVREGAAVAVLG